mgnify:CR=1 FL=1
MKYFTLLCRAVHLFLFGWITDSFTRLLDKRLERVLNAKKPLSKKALTAYARFCETLFEKWQKHEKNYLLFQNSLGAIHSHNDF